jgi:hypothetical protein
MLIYATRFQDVQNHVADQVSHHMRLLGDQIRYGGPRSAVEDALHGLWERDFAVTTAASPSGEAPPVAWGKVWPQILSAIEKIQVQAVNSSVVNPLQYHEHRQGGMSVIAVAGNKLHPGLTLEGLTVSYCLQVANLSTTLVQMARSFGYRPGYEDLCRLYATPILNDALIEISRAQMETLRDFEVLARDKGQTGIK